MENKPRLSVVMPAIRRERWLDVYNSIVDSLGSFDFELIICGPYSLPPVLEHFQNIKYIRDYGSPTRCSQIAATLAEGRVITWTADDGLFVKNALEEVLDFLDEKRKQVLNPIVTCKYSEGNSGPQPDSYYKLVNAYPRTPLVDDKWWILNLGFMYREHFIQMGGWNCLFETTALAHADLAFRCQASGQSVVYLFDSNKVVLDCGHMPGTSGDHAPVHFGHIEHDEPLYRELRSKYVGLTKIDLNNWQKSPAIWKRRFV